MPKLDINLKEGTKPISLPPYHGGPEKNLEIRRQVAKMLEDGVARPSTSPFAAPVTLVKKADGTMRFITDFRKLNDATIKDKYPLLRIDDTFNIIAGNIYFSTLDLLSRFWQIKIEEKDKYKTAFITAGGLYEYNRMPFGLTNAPSVFQRIMDLTVMSSITLGSVKHQ